MAEKATLNEIEKEWSWLDVELANEALDIYLEMIEESQKDDS